MVFNEFYKKNKGEIDKFTETENNYYLEGIITKVIDFYEGSTKLSLEISRILPTNFKDKKTYMIKLSEMEIPDERFVVEGSETVIFGERLKEDPEKDDILAKKFINLSADYKFPSNNSTQ